MEGRAPLPATITIRPIRPEDGPALGAFYGGLSDESLRSRFHAVCHGISDRTAATFCGPDHEHREGFVAVEDAAGDATIVGHLCLEPTEDGALELAVAVADRLQGQGIGRALLAAAVDWARQHGIVRLRASMLASNAAILGLVRSARLPTSLSAPRDGVVTATMEVEPVLSTAA